MLLWPMNKMKHLTIYHFFRLSFAPTLLKFGYVIFECIFYARTMPFYFIFKILGVFLRVLKIYFLKLWKKVKKKKKEGLLSALGKCINVQG